MILGPVIRDRKGEHLATLEEIRRQGFAVLRVDGEIHETEETIKLAKDEKAQHRGGCRPPRLSAPG